MDNALVEIVVLVVGVGLGALGRHFGWKQRIPEPIIREVVKEILVKEEVPETVSGRKKVTFRWKDGTEDHKTLFENTILPTMPWKGRSFEQVAEKDGSLIYHEQA